MKRMKQILIVMLMAVLLCGNTLTVFAEPDDNDSENNNNYGSPSDR